MDQYLCVLVPTDLRLTTITFSCLQVIYPQGSIQKKLASQQSNSKKTVTTPQLTIPMCAMQADQRRWTSPVAASKPPKAVVRTESDASLASLLLCYHQSFETTEDFRWYDRVCASTLQAPSYPVRQDRWLDSPFAAMAPMYPARKDMCGQGVLEFSATSCCLTPEPSSPSIPNEASARSA